MARDLNARGAQRQHQLLLFGDPDRLVTTVRLSSTSSPKSRIRLFRPRKQP